MNESKSVRFFMLINNKIDNKLCMYNIYKLCLKFLKKIRETLGMALHGTKKISRTLTVQQDIINVTFKEAYTANCAIGFCVFSHLILTL